MLTDTAAATWPDQGRGPRLCTGERTVPPSRPSRRIRPGRSGPPMRRRTAPDACAPALRDVCRCALASEEPLLSVPGPLAEVVACRAARPSAPGALAIGGTHGRCQVGRHMRGLAWPSCPRDRNRHNTAARGGLLPLARAWTCARHQHGCRLVGLRFGAAAAVSLSPRGFGLERWPGSNEGWPLHAVAHARVGGRAAGRGACLDFRWFIGSFASFVYAATGRRSIAVACAGVRGITDW